MSFNEQLQQAFDTLNDRLRDELARHTRAVVDELAAAAHADRDRAVEEAARAERERAATEAARAADEAARAVDAAKQEAAEAAKVAADAAARAELQIADLTARERLLAAMRAMDRARSLTDVFDALSVGAEREAPRAAVLLVRDATLRSWRLTGFGASFDGSPDLQMPVEKSGAIAEALRTLAAVTVSNGDPVAAPPFDLPGGRARMAFPMTIAGQPVAVLYADEGPENGPAPDAKGGWAVAVEILARHAARSLEALTAFKTAASLTDRAPLQPISSSSLGDRPSDADEAARRYARLLVSEIKMYHEAEVAAGRREGDLATRLGGEIQRARSLYEERVPQQVRLRTDFFQAELVRTLADGDASLLDAKS
jgi:hypothetical protein